MRVLLLVAPLLVLCEAAQAQVQDRVATGWFTVGIGGGVDGYAVLVEGTYQVREHLFSARLASVGAIYRSGVWDLGVLYGRSTRGEHWRAHVAGGVAVVGGEDCNIAPGCQPKGTALGLPLSAGVSWRASKVFGLGVLGFANVNEREPFGGIAVTVLLGKLR